MSHLVGYSPTESLFLVTRFMAKEWCDVTIRNTPRVEARSGALRTALTRSAFFGRGAWLDLRPRQPRGVAWMPGLCLFPPAGEGEGKDGEEGSDHSSLPRTKPLPRPPLLRNGTEARHQTTPPCFSRRRQAYGLQRSLRSQPEAAEDKPQLGLLSHLGRRTLCFPGVETRGHRGCPAPPRH